MKYAPQSPPAIVVWISLSFPVTACTAWASHRPLSGHAFATASLHHTTPVHHHHSDTTPHLSTATTATIIATASHRTTPALFLCFSVWRNTWTMLGGFSVLQNMWNISDVSFSGRVDVIWPHGFTVPMSCMCDVCRLMVCVRARMCVMYASGTPSDFYIFFWNLHKQLCINFVSALHKMCMNFV